MEILLLNNYWRSHAELKQRLQAMADTPQEPDYHAEGDVLTHTLMVMEELEKLLQHYTLTERQQYLLRLAVVFHDMAKPLVTRVEDGRISSAGHARRGAQLALRLLHEAGDLTPEEIRQVYFLVKYHGRPLWLQERDLEREARMLSLTLDPQLLSVLVESDLRGRISPHTDEMLLRLEIYREEAQRLNAWTGSAGFPDAHTRYAYFNLGYDAPDYTYYDDTRLDVYILCGLPGVGKDHWLNENMPELPVVSLDEIRRKNGWEARRDWGRAAQAGKEQAKAYARAGRSFAWNATNIRLQSRQDFMRTLLPYKPRFHIIWLNRPMKTIQAQNAAREFAVPDGALWEMLEGFELPMLTESHSLQMVES